MVNLTINEKNDLNEVYECLVTKKSFKYIKRVFYSLLAYIRYLFRKEE